MCRDPKRFTPAFFVGILLLILAQNLSLLLSRRHLASVELTDAVVGLCYGLAIGCMLFSIIQKRCQPR